MLQTMSIEYSSDLQIKFLTTKENHKSHLNFPESNIGNTNRLGRVNGSLGVEDFPDFKSIEI